jgi:predicted nuclease with TOPRIM domain
MSQRSRASRPRILRPSDADALGAAQPAVGEWVGELLAQLADRGRQLEAMHELLRQLERRNATLEAENSGLRGKVRDLQSVLRALGAAMGESVNVLTMPDTPND